MKKQLFIILGILFISNFLFAQNDTLHKRFKIFLNGSYVKYYDKDSWLNQPPNQTFLSTHNDISIGFISFSIEKYFRNGNSREIELLPINIHRYQFIDEITKVSQNLTQPTAGTALTSIETYCRYQYNFNIFKFNNKMISPFIGVSSNYFFDKTVNYTNIKIYSLKFKQTDLITKDLSNNYYQDKFSLVMGFIILSMGLICIILSFIILRNSKVKAPVGNIT